MFQNRGRNAGIQRDGRLAEADRPVDVDLLGDHVEPREGARQAAALHQNVTLFCLDDVIGAERVRAKLRIGAGDRCRRSGAQDIARRQQRRGGVDEGAAIDGDPVRIGDDDMRTCAGDRQRPLEGRPEGGSRACHLVDDGAGVRRTVVQFDAVAWHIEMSVTVMAGTGGAGRGLDIDDDGRAGTAGLADLGRIGMLDDTGDVRCERRRCKHMNGQERGREKAAETHAEADMVHLHPLTARRSNTGI